MEMLDDKKINSLIGWQKSVSTDFASIIENIKQNYASDVIKDWETVPIIRLETLEEVGYCIKIYLNGKYNYGKAILNDWEKKLKQEKYLNDRTGEIMDIERSEMILDRLPRGNNNRYRLYGNEF